MFSVWREIKLGVKKGFNSVRKALKWESGPTKPLSKLGLALEEALTHENWLRVVYKSAIDSKGKLLTKEQMSQLKQVLTLLLPTVSTLEEDFKILEMFLALRYSEGIFPIDDWLKGVSASRYREVTKELLLVERGYFEGLLAAKVIDVEELRWQRGWIKRLFLLEKPFEQREESVYQTYQVGLMDWIYRMVSLFMQQLHLLIGHQDLSYLLERYELDYLEFADDVYGLVSHFLPNERAALYERLRLWYVSGASHYNELPLESKQLSVEKQVSFSFRKAGEVRADFEEKWQETLAKIAQVYERDYKHLREWARFASRSAFIELLSDSNQGLIAYQRFYETFLEKRRVLQDVLWGFRSKVEVRLRELPEKGDEYLTALDALDKQLIEFNEQLTGVSEAGILGACFELNERSVAHSLGDKLRYFLTELTAFIGKYEPLLEWLRQSCYCVTTTEGVIGYEMNQRIQKARGADIADALDYNELTQIDSMTDYVFRALSCLVEDKRELLTLHPDKNQVLNELGHYGGGMVVGFLKDALIPIHAWKHSQWGSFAEGSLQLAVLSANTLEENKVFLVIEEPKHRINIAVLGLKAAYIKRIESAHISLTKQVRSAESIPPACILYEGEDVKLDRELWLLSTITCQIWDTESRELERKRIELEAITEEARAEINSNNRKIAYGLLKMGLSAVRKRANSSSDALNEMVLDYIYSSSKCSFILEPLTDSGWTREGLGALLEALLSEEQELSKGKEEEVVTLTDGIALLSVSSSGEGLLGKENQLKLSKEQEAPIELPKEEQSTLVEAKRRSGSCGWQFFRGEVVQLTETTGLIASPGLSSAGSDTE